MTVEEASPQSAVLVHAPAGDRQLARFIPSGDGEILVSTHVPATKPVARLLICNSFGHPFAQNYRREVLLARQLTADGIVSARINYRGTGESSGQPGELTTATMIEDAEAALAELAKTASETPLFVLGTHWGAYVASMIAMRHPGARLILWDPVLDGTSVTRQLLRGIWATSALDSTGSKQSKDQLLESLRSEGTLDVIGYEYSWAFHKDATARSFDDLALPDPTEILLIGFKKRGELPAKLLALHQKLESQGHAVELIHANATETWWLNDSGEFIREENSDFTRLALQHTTSWVRRFTTSGVLAN